MSAIGSMRPSSYRALGSQPTPRARRSRGSLNQFFVFSDYLEFLSPGSGARPDLVGFPVGLKGLAFALKDAYAVHRELQGRGIPVQPVQRSRAMPICRTERRRGSIQRDAATGAG